MPRKLSAKAAFICSIIVGLLDAAIAAEPINKDYVRSLSAPDRVVFVMEYWDASEQLSQREGFKSISPFEAISPTEFALSDGRNISLYGVEPCSGPLKIPRDGFDGTCTDFGRMQLEIFLKPARVIFCRAFVRERGKKKQQATCFAHHLFPGSLNSVDMLEEQLVSIGALRLTRDAGGRSQRSDLEEAERIGKLNGFGMWLSEPQSR